MFENWKSLTFQNKFPGQTNDQKLINSFKKGLKIDQEIKVD